MRLASLCLLALLLAGCATVHQRAQSRPAAVVPPAGDAQGAAGGEPPADASLLTSVQQVRELSRRARPASSAALTAERWSPGLAAAIARRAAAPTPANDVGLGQAYVRAGIRDQAYEPFARAARADPRLGAAWDGLARIWRDWGFPHLGLGDAHRAVWASPESPEVRNTLGTILQLLGDGREARLQFARAISLDPDAAYAHSNMCYSWLMEANVAAAVASCSEALAIEPGLTPSRNNLALARAMSGDLAGAEQIFGQTGGQAAAQYNVGIIYLSQRRFAKAADAFDRAARLQPAPHLAGARARQARALAAEAPEDGRGNDERR